MFVFRLLSAVIFGTLLKSGSFREEKFRMVAK
jgi:hypothetical protein